MIHLIPVIDWKHLTKLAFNFYLSHFTARAQSTGQGKQSHRKQIKWKSVWDSCRVTHGVKFTPQYGGIIGLKQTMCSSSERFTPAFYLKWFAPFSFVSPSLLEVSAICRGEAKVCSMTITTNREAAITVSQCEAELKDNRARRDFQRSSCPSICL